MSHMNQVRLKSRISSCACDVVTHAHIYPHLSASQKIWLRNERNLIMSIKCISSLTFNLLFPLFIILYSEAASRSRDSRLLGPIHQIKRSLLISLLNRRHLMDRIHGAVIFLPGLLTPLIALSCVCPHRTIAQTLR